MGNHIYCLYAILWTFVINIITTIEDYLDKYLLKNTYSDGVEAVASLMTAIIWSIPFCILMWKGIQ